MNTLPELVASMRSLGVVRLAMCPQGQITEIVLQDARPVTPAEEPKQLTPKELEQVAKLRAEELERLLFASSAG